MFVLLVLVLVSAAAAEEEFQPDWETGLARFPKVVEQRMLRIQTQMFDMIHKRDLDKLHRIFTLIEEALLPIHLPALKTPVEEHLASLHEHYVEQSGSIPVARISPQEITALKEKFRSYLLVCHRSDLLLRGKNHPKQQVFCTVRMGVPEKKNIFFFQRIFFLTAPT